eukprot:347408-Rhodomonas_salina.3
MKKSGERPVVVIAVEAVGAQRPLDARAQVLLRLAAVVVDPEHARLPHSTSSARAICFCFCWSGAAHWFVLDFVLRAARLVWHLGLL